MLDNPGVSYTFVFFFFQACAGPSAWDQPFPQIPPCSWCSQESHTSQNNTPYLPAACTQLQGFFHINLAQLPFSHRIYHSVFSISLSKIASHFIFCPWKPSRQYLLKGKNSITEIILLSQETSGLWTSSSCHC